MFENKKFRNAQSVDMSDEVRMLKLKKLQEDIKNRSKIFSKREEYFTRPTKITCESKKAYLS